MELYAAAAKYLRVLELNAETPVDLVVATVWPGEGLVCLHDPRLATATVLVTPVKLMLDRQMLAGEPFETMARIERAVLRRSRFVHSTTSAIAADTAATFGLTLPPSDGVPLFLADRARTSGIERHASADQTEVLFVGRPEPRKGADLLVRAARTLAQAHPRTVYVFVGQGSWDALRAEVEADDTVRGRVRFLGEVDEARLWRLYAGSDVVCVPSRYESFGYALIEAMMFGKPIVASGVGGMPATVENGATALLCRPDDPESLSDQLARLLSDADLRRALGRRARSVYEDRYSAERGAERTAELYMGMAAEHQRSRGESARAAAPGSERADSTSAAVRESFSEDLAEIVGLAPAAARNLAIQLLAPGPASEAADSRDGHAGEHAEAALSTEQWRARALEAERQTAELRATLEVIVRSHSWRLTKPLRALRGRSANRRRASA